MITSVYTVLATALLVFGVVIWSASRIDELSQERQSRTVASALAKSVQKIPYDQESVTIWDDAVQKLQRPYDVAWIEANLGVWMYAYFKHDRIFIVDPDGKPIYRMIDGKTVADDTTPLDRSLKDVLAALHKMTAHGGIRAWGKHEGDVPRITDLSEVDGRPVLISAMPVVAETQDAAQDIAQAHTLVSVRFLDASFVTDLAETHHINGVRFSHTADIARHEQSYPLKNRSGATIGYVVWSSDRPGFSILNDVLPVLATGLAAISIAVVLLIASLRRTYRDLVFSEAESKHRAVHDPLTGLANRGFFNERVETLLAESRMSGAPLALLFLDLDRFKQVNDTLGHPVGDALIQEVARRISATLSTDDLIARIGGDEFAIIKRENVSRDQVENLCRNIIAIVSQPVDVGGQLASVGISIGVGLSPEAGTEWSELARNADVALYQAKHGGGLGFAFYNEEMSRTVKERQALEADLRRALEGEGELEVVYQPLVSARDFSMTGVEALIRWNHPRLGVVLPPAFIPIAEDSGLIDKLGEKVLREACRTAGALDIDTVAVNVSATQLQHPDFAERLLSILSHSGMDPRRLELEITEGTLLEASGTPARVLRELRDKGIRIALDDFGTGYSSLNYLIKLEVDRIKLDRSFLQDIDSCTRSSSVVHSIVAMAKAVGVSVTAEGVETEAQRDFLQTIACDTMQGYLFSPPVSALSLIEDFAVGFRRWHPVVRLPKSADPRVA